LPNCSGLERSRKRSYFVEVTSGPDIQSLSIENHKADVKSLVTRRMGRYPSNREAIPTCH